MRSQYNTGRCAEGEDADKQKQRARRILSEVWASEGLLTPFDAEWLDRYRGVPHGFPKEMTALDIALALAGLTFDWRAIEFNTSERARKLRKILDATD